MFSRYKRVLYEDLVDKTQETLRDAYKFMEVPFTEEVQRYKIILLFFY